MFSPVVISFYTLQTPYEQEVIRLKRSCEKFALEARIQGIPSKGSWEANVAIKPRFILEQLQELNRPVLWVDADAEFLKPPTWSEFEGFDLSVRVNEELPKYHPSRIMTGTLFANPTPETLALMSKWAEECERELKVIQEIDSLFGRGLRQNCLLDQIVLRNLLEEPPSLKFRPLPPAYVKIFDLDQNLEAIIEHHQASRRLTVVK